MKRQDFHVFCFPFAVSAVRGRILSNEGDPYDR